MKPNVLVILPDGTPGHIIDSDSQVIAPNLKRLMLQGTRFPRAYATLPTCSPSRASLMTGLLPHNHGVLQVEHCVDDDQSVLRTENRHWAQHLQDAGYKTGYFGKWHIERTNDLAEFGWEVDGGNHSAAHRSLGAGHLDTDTMLEDSPLVQYETGPEGYRDILHYALTSADPESREFAVTTSRALEYLSDSSESEQPWACCLSFAGPNTPVCALADKYELYDVDGIQLPPNSEDDMAGKPALYSRVRSVYRDIADRGWRELRACYYALLTELDTQVGRLLDFLVASGQMENTIVVFASDHGRYLGSHGLDAHNFAAFEDAYRVPLIMSGPGIRQNATASGLASLADLGATITDLCGVEVLTTSDAQSLRPLLETDWGSSPPEAFRSCYAEYHGTRFPLMQRILWRDNWKFVFNGFDRDEMYNLETDPYELENLADDLRHKEIGDELMSGVWDRIRKTGDRALIETHYSPMRFARVGPLDGLASRDENEES